MITVITGLPGNGKTLYALSYVKAYAEKENRDVFYAGIKDLRLPWTEIKPEDWPTMPTGAIIVIDEAQFVFPKKPNGSKLPDFYEKLAVHRHSGYDIFIITQHPSLVDNFVRNLCGRHLHVIRKFGMSRANVWEWPGANTSPEKASSHKNAVLHKFGYPKEVYEYYKSAEVHTVKRSFPMRLIVAILFVLCVIAVGIYVFNRLVSKGTKKDDAAIVGVAGSAASSAVPVPANRVALDPVADAMQYVFQTTPRLPGLPQTEPRYDELTKPTSVPVPAACVSSGDRCNCYSQQATAMNVPKLICLEIVARGFYQDFNPSGKEPDLKANQPVFQEPKLASNERQNGSPVVSLTQEGYGVLGATGRGKPQSAL